MPVWLPEGNVSLSTDDERRSLWKWADCLFQRVGPIAMYFPEGNMPLASDDEERLYQKINLSLLAQSGAIVGIGGEGGGAIAGEGGGVIVGEG